MEPEDIKISESQSVGLSLIEQQYWLSGQVPTYEEIADKVGVTVGTVENWFKRNESFRFVLRSKGFPLPEDQKTGVLTPQQLMVTNMLLNLADKRSQREKLEVAGVSAQQYQMWRRDPNFMSYMQERARIMFKDASDVAAMTVLKNMEAGDLNAARFFYELTGVYNPRVQVDVNVDSIMSRVVEIIQKHVRDPQVMLAIAEDLDRLAGGTKPNLAPAIDATAVPLVLDVSASG